jgi:hypothetical protein
MENSARDLRFVQLQKETLKPLVLTDVSFTNNKDYSPQIEYPKPDTS